MAKTRRIKIVITASMIEPNSLGVIAHTIKDSLADLGLTVHFVTFPTALRRKGRNPLSIEWEFNRGR